jgi:hypothetical protein
VYVVSARSVRFAVMSEVIVALPTTGPGPVTSSSSSSPTHAASAAVASRLVAVRSVRESERMESSGQGVMGRERASTPGGRASTGTCRRGARVASPGGHGSVTRRGPYGAQVSPSWKTRPAR